MLTFSASCQDPHDGVVIAVVRLLAHPSTGADGGRANIR